MKKYGLILVVIILFVSSILFMQFQFWNEYNTDDILHNALDTQNFSKVIQRYANSNPSIETRYILGNENAPISVIVVLDFLSDASNTFYNTTVQKLIEEYIDSGSAKLYYKYYMPVEDYKQKKDRFIYASAANCYMALGGTNLSYIHLVLSRIRPFDEQQVSILTNISKEKLHSCIMNSNASSLYDDMLETSKFRIMAPSLHIWIRQSSSTILLGDSSWQKINQTMRSKQVELGI